MNKKEIAKSPLSTFLKPKKQTRRNSTISAISKKIGVKEKLLLLTLYSKGYDRMRFYKKNEIPKRNGENRIIHAVSGSLWWIQKKVHIYFSDSDRYKPHTSAMGFVKEKGIIKHASIHKNKKLIMSFDIKDFFPSITFPRVWGMFQAFPFDLSKEEATVYSQICCLPDERGSIPQGGITSPYISNMLCRRLDARLLKFSVDRNMHYSRYADDLTFSTNENVNFPKITSFVKETLNEEGFEINESKSRLMKKSDRQVVTGIIVNQGLNVNRKYIRSLRSLIYQCSKNGIYKEATKNYLNGEFKPKDNRIFCYPYYIDSEGNQFRSNGRPLKYKDPVTGDFLSPYQNILNIFKQHVQGRIEFVKHVADSNKDIIIKERRMRIINKLEKEWVNVIAKDNYFKQFYSSSRKGWFDGYKAERERVLSATNIDEIISIKNNLNNKNDVRFNIGMSDDIDKIKEEMIGLLKFPPFDVNKTIDFLTTLASSGRGVLAKMLHKQDMVRQDEIEQQFKQFNDDRYYLNQNLQTIVLKFFKDYIEYFRKNDLKKLKPDEHNYLWDKIIVPFKNKTRFHDREGESEDSKRLIDEILRIVKARNKREHKRNTNLPIKDSLHMTIFTDVDKVTWGMERLVESMLKNTLKNNTITINGESQSEGISGYKITLENDVVENSNKNIWRNRKKFNRKLGKVLDHLNGLVFWYITFNTDEGRVTYDVYNNDIDCDLYKDGIGFKHTIIFPYAKS